jgi:predicted PurR-regulated permease PerM
MRIERQILFWLVAAAVLLAIIGALKAILLPFVAGIVIAFFLNPVADRLTGWGVSRFVASLVIVGCGLLLAIALAVFVGPLLFDQARQFAAALPGEIERLRAVVEATARNWLGSNFDAFKQGLDQAAETARLNGATIAGEAVTSLWSHGLALVNFVSLMLVTPLVVFYVLVDWHPMLVKIDSWLPRQHQPAIRRLAGDINDAVSAFIRGQGTVCIILGVFYAVALSLIGLNYGLLVGLVTGALAFVPVVGWVLGIVTATGLAVVQFWPDTLPIVLVVAVFLAGQALDAGFLSPNIVGSKIGLHPVWLIFALFVFSYLFGLVGTLVAVPVAAAIAVLIRFGLDLYLSSALYSGADPNAEATAKLAQASAP